MLYALRLFFVCEGLTYKYFYPMIYFVMDHAVKALVMSMLYPHFSTLLICQFIIFGYQNYAAVIPSRDLFCVNLIILLSLCQ